MRRTRAGLAAVLVSLAAAAVPEVQAGEAFAPERFFAGRTHSEGAFVDGQGRATKRFSGDTAGRREPDGSTVFDQVIRFDDGTVRRRTFRLVRTGPTSIEATGSEVVGTGRGTISGRSLRLLSTISQDGNPLTALDFDQTFSLSSDARRLRNVSTISKLGIVVARTDETFVRLGPGRRARRTR